MKQDKSWWLVLIQGLVALGLALYIFFAQDSAVTAIGLIAAGYVFVIGLMHTIGAFMSANRSNTLLYRGIGGLIIGGLLLGMFFFGWGGIETAYTILALGLLVFGGLGLWAFLFDRGGREFEWGPIFVNAALAFWGVMVFVARGQSFNLATVSAWVLLAIGAVMTGWAFYMRSRKESSPS